MSNTYHETPVSAAPVGCSCHPDDRPPVPCPRKHALRDCRRAAVLAETDEFIIALKKRDQTPQEKALLGYAMRVRDALDI